MVPDLGKLATKISWGCISSSRTSSITPFKIISSDKMQFAYLASLKPEKLWWFYVQCIFSRHFSQNWVADLMHEPILPLECNYTGEKNHTAIALRKTWLLHKQKNHATLAYKNSVRKC